MILDSQHQYAAAQVLAATGVSTNVIDHGSDRELGVGEPLAVLIVITAIDATSADETYTVQLQADDNVGFATPLPVGGLVNVPRAIGANSKVVIPVPPDTAMERFSRLSWTLGGTTPSITYSAFLVPQSFIQNNVLYDDALTIS